MSNGYGKLVAERGSLRLYHFEGNDLEPETFTVALRDNESISGSLEVAREWFELSCGDYKLNGSQAVTAKKWYEEFL